jgi:uncharacterized membrane protein YhaH (DUF805 family)
MSILYLLFSFRGRIKRKTYWLTLFGILLMVWLLLMLELRVLLVIPLFSLLALQVKRCRDSGWPPWLPLLPLILTLTAVALASGQELHLLLQLMVAVEVLMLIIIGIPGAQLLHRGHGFSAGPRTLNDGGFRIIQCSNCHTRIRVSFPPPLGVGRCPLCRSGFTLKSDGYGNLVVYAQGSGHGGGNTTEIGSREDALRILGVEPGATPLQIRQAYKEKMRQYHPDKVSQLGEEIRELADRMSKQINRAYHFLRDHE